MVVGWENLGKVVALRIQSKFMTKMLCSMGFE